MFEFDKKQFMLMIWKNFKIQFNNKIFFFYQLFFPVLAVILIIYVYNPGEKIHFPIKFYEEIPINLDILRIIGPEKNITISKWELVYAPQNDMIEQIVKMAADRLDLIVVPKKTVTDLLAYMVQPNPSFISVEFYNIAHRKTVPRNLKYAIRLPGELRFNELPITGWETNLFTPVIKKWVARNREENDGGKPGYIREGFIAVQNAISLAFIESLAIQEKKEINMPEIVMQRFPMPSYEDDPLEEFIGKILPSVLILGNLVTAAQIVKNISLEKEVKMKEYLNIMGLNERIYWLSWFINIFLIMLVSTFFAFIVLKFGMKSGSSLLTYSNFAWIVIFYTLYCLSSITFCFMLSAIFTDAKTATILTVIIWITSAAGFAFLDSLTYERKLFSCFFPNAALYYGIHIITSLEVRRLGLRWSTIFSPIHYDDISMSDIFIILFFGSLMFMTLSLYIDKINPGNYGTAEKWDFPFQKEYWKSLLTSEKRVLSKRIKGTIMPERRGSAYEVPASIDILVCVRGLTKQLGNVDIIKNVTFYSYEDEITTLLGQDNSSRSTILWAIVGLTTPSSGTIILNGYEMNKYSKARKYIGFRPQFNTLFKNLSAKDHIKFFSKVKGTPEEYVQMEVEKFANDFSFDSKALKTESKNLSEIMKIKLSMGIAFCGGSKIVILDDPCLGLDSKTREFFWDYFEKEKSDRTIIMSTSSIDEADAISDKIGVVTGGELVCYGSPKFLRRKYGVGYYLICAKTQECITRDVTDFLQDYIPEIEVDNSSSSEVSYYLAKSDISIYKEMLSNLENNLNRLGLYSYSINTNSLQEVISGTAAEKQLLPARKTIMFNKQDNSNDLTTLENKDLKKNVSLIRAQWRAMILKKIIYNKRNKFILLAQILVPISCIIALIISPSLHRVTEIPIILTMEAYETSMSVVEQGADADHIEQFIAAQFRNYLRLFGSTHKVKTASYNFDDFLINECKDTVVSEYVIAGSFHHKKIISWFNNDLLHSAPLALNAIHNSILKALFPSNPNYFIDVYNHPLPLQKATLLNLQLIDIGLEMAITICMTLSFVSAFYIIFIIKERESRVKSVQFTCGLRMWIFWFSHFIFDEIMYVITILLMMFTLHLFDVDGFILFSHTSRIFIVLLLFGFASIPQTYVMSYFYSKPLEGFSGAAIFYFISGAILNVWLTYIKSFSHPWIARILRCFGIIFPHCSLYESMISIIIINHRETSCLRECEYFSNCTMENLCKLHKICCINYFELDTPGIGGNVIFMLLSLILYWYLLFKLGRRNRLIFSSWSKIKTPLEPKDEDDDVRNERILIENLSEKEISSNNVVIKNLTKFLGKLLAVNQISARVQQDECFGILAFHDSSKTKTFELLSGEENISFGDVFYKGVSVKNNIQNIYRHISYCPKSNPVFDDFTGREILAMYSRIRGIPIQKINPISDSLANSFGFWRYLDKRIFDYTPIMKRSLSISAALIGTPSIIILDEPTTVMDTLARRRFWETISKFRNNQRSIVLGSCNLRECEQQCARLAIMVDGKFQGLGSPQYLKNKFSKAIELKINLFRQSDPEISTFSRFNPISSTLSVISNKLFAKEQDEPSQPEERRNSSLTDVLVNATLVEFINKKFPGAILKTHHDKLYTFELSKEKIKFSDIFGIMEANRATLGIEDYSVRQITLEQIFMSSQN